LNLPLDFFAVLTPYSAVALHPILNFCNVAKTALCSTC